MAGSKLQSLSLLSERPLKDWAKEPVDGVLEMVGGDFFSDCVSVLKPGGRLCSVGALTGGPASFSVWDLMHGLQLTGWSSEDMDRSQLQSAMDAVMGMHAEGRIKVPQRRGIALEEAALAHELMESGAFSGRIVLVP